MSRERHPPGAIPFSREPHAPPPLLTPTDQENLRALWGKMFEEAEENGRTVIIK